MPVVLMREWDNPKDPERKRKKLKFSSEVSKPYWKKLFKEKGIKSKYGTWSDNMGHMISWVEFEM